MTRHEHAPVWTADSLADPHRVGDKARRVRHMFDAIAPSYRLVNTLASVGRDASWRRRGVALARVRPDDDVLDVACGTGDFARAFAAGEPTPRSVRGTDFSGNMLRLAATGDGKPVTWCQADAHHLPFSDGAFSIVSCAFGIRNFQRLSVGLSEMRRVLRPGGRAIILEFSMPRRPILRRLYQLYMLRIMPVAATLVSRDKTGAYRYLPKSVLSFADQAEIIDTLGRSGFATVEAHSLTCGIVTAYVAGVS